PEKIQFPMRTIGPVECEGIRRRNQELIYVIRQQVSDRRQGAAMRLLPADGAKVLMRSEIGSDQIDLDAEFGRDLAHRSFGRLRAPPVREFDVVSENEQQAVDPRVATQQGVKGIHAAGETKRCLPARRGWRRK